MSIKTKFIIVAVISLMATLATGLILFQDTFAVRKEIEKQTIINEVQNDIFERVILRDEYLLYHGERPLIQLQAVSKDFDQLLVQTSKMLLSIGEQASVNLLADNKKFIDQTFSKIIAEPSPELEQQLIGQIFIKSQDNITIASQLADASRNSVTRGQQSTIFFVLILLIGVSLIIIVALYFIWRSIGQPLLALKETAVRISALDFSSTTTTTTTTTTPSNDEMGQLARAFNTMVGKLKESYTSLQNANKAMLNVSVDLEEREEKLKTIFEVSPVGISVLNAENKIVYENSALQSILGMSKEGLLRGEYKNRTYLKSDGTPMIPTEESASARATREKRPVYNIETGVMKENGGIVWVRVSAVPVTFPDWKMVIVTIDITKEKEIDKAKTEFVSLASHQLRTPLTTVSWYTEMILRGDVGKIIPGQKKYLEEIYQGNQRMIELVNTLLDVSRIELGTFNVEPKQTDVLALARSVLDEQKPKIEKKGLIVTDDFSKNVPVLLIDPKLLRMVFQNLLANAVEYTPSGGKIEFTISVSNANGKVPPTNYKLPTTNLSSILIKVSDTGYGIPKNQQSQIFTKMFRADNVREKDTDGTGLGLYIVKSVVENSGGKIWFESPAPATFFVETTDVKKATAGNPARQSTDGSSRMAGGEENPGTTFYVTLPLITKKKENTL